MTTAHYQRMHRHPEADWAELRVCSHTQNCYRVHTHAEYSIGIVDEGGTVFHHPDGVERLEPGDVVLIEPNVPHACNPPSEQNWSYRMLYVDAAWLHARLAAIWGNATPLHGLRFWRRALHDLSSARMVDSLCQPLASAADAGRLAAALPDWLANHAHPAMPDHTQAHTELAPAWRLLHTGTADQRLSVQALADACHMSPAQFIRRFAAAHGMTPGRYMRNLRLNAARQLIAQGTSLADAAHAMGFSDQAHMQRLFKSHHAITPGQYAR